MWCSRIASYRNLYKSNKFNDFSFRFVESIVGQPDAVHYNQINIRMMRPKRGDKEQLKDTERWSDFGFLTFQCYAVCAAQSQSWWRILFLSVSSFRAFALQHMHSIESNAIRAASNCIIKSCVCAKCALNGSARRPLAILIASSTPPRCEERFRSSGEWWLLQ